jgi:hypothetical protein
MTGTFWMTAVETETELTRRLIPETRLRLSHVLTTYDRKQSTKRGFNPYALAQYFMALDTCAEMVAEGKTWPQAISAVFTDRIEALLLKAVN